MLLHAVVTAQCPDTFEQTAWTVREWLQSCAGRGIPATCPKSQVYLFVPNGFDAGINFARDGMVRKDWLALVAVHSDAWLMSVAFYYGAKLDANAR